MQSEMPQHRPCWTVARKHLSCTQAVDLLDCLLVEVAVGGVALGAVGESCFGLVEAGKEDQAVATLVESDVAVRFQAQRAFEIG
jgi:hypothetical protein